MKPAGHGTYGTRGAHANGSAGAWVPPVCHAGTGDGRPGGTVVVGGMVWRMARRVHGSVVEDAVLSGPAIGAALGVRAAGSRPALMAAVPAGESADGLRLVRRLDPCGALVRQLPLAPLRWVGSAVIGNTLDWTLEGDPRRWTATGTAAQLDGATLALANASPSAYAALLSTVRPGFVAMDLDGRWGPSQLDAIKSCLRHVQLLTVGRADLARLPKDLLAGSGIGQRAGTALLVKDGAAGVRVRIADEVRHWPAPAVAAGVRTDAGAGDLLLGLLAALLGPAGMMLAHVPTHVPTHVPNHTLDHELDHARAEAAYARALPVLAQLLASTSLAAFGNALLDTADDHA